MWSALGGPGRVRPNGQSGSVSGLCQQPVLRCGTGEVLKGVVTVVDDWNMGLAIIVLLDVVKFGSSEVLVDRRGSSDGGSSCNPVKVVVEGRMTQG